MTTLKMYNGRAVLKKNKKERSDVMESLKVLRKKRGLTQKELGKILGLDSTSVSKYELSKRIPSLRNAFKLANFFNVPIEEIFPEFGRRSLYPGRESKLKGGVGGGIANEA